MNYSAYLLDTHTLIFWITKENMSQKLIEKIDEYADKGMVYFSSISIWETALLVKKGRISIGNLHNWERDLTAYSPLNLLNPTSTDMIDSTLLPDHHKDPFDRLLIAQAKNKKAQIITKDKMISKYKIKTLWM